MDLNWQDASQSEDRRKEIIQSEQQTEQIRKNQNRASEKSRTLLSSPVSAEWHVGRKEEKQQGKYTKK